MREMKDSGVEWIGAIPADWSISRIKYVAEFDPVCNKSAINGSSLITYTPMDCIKHGWFINNSAPLESLSTSLTTYQEGDIVMAKVTPCFENGNIAIMEGLHNGFGMGSSELFVFRPKCIDTKFFFYWLQNNAFVQKAKATMTGTGGLKRVSPVFTRNCPVHIPPYEDQRRIALFLDDKVDQVNILIANVQAQIEKLKAYKQSLITEVVTKGLAPTVPMKDSGVEWIGKIPAHWEVTRIKDMFDLRNERNDEADLSKVNLISLYTDLGVVQHSDLTETTGNRAVTAEGYKFVHKNDIVVNIILCWMGAVGMSKYDGVTSPAYDIYRPLEGTNSEYYHYLFRTNRFNGECYRYGRGIMMMRWRTYSTEFRAINIPCPPADEQRKIVDYLNEKSSQVDRLIAIKQAKIEKLEQYKHSLIYEYVTGKKEVV